MIQTPSERRAAAVDRHVKSLAELVNRLPRSFDDVVKLSPQSKEQVGWLALDIGKTFCYAPGAYVDLVKAGNRLRLYALGLLGEPCGESLAPSECPLAARLAQLESLIKEREAA